MAGQRRVRATVAVRHTGSAVDPAPSKPKRPVLKAALRAGAAAGRAVDAIEGSGAAHDCGEFFSVVMVQLTAGQLENFVRTSLITSAATAAQALIRRHRSPWSLLARTVLSGKMLGIPQETGRSSPCRKPLYEAEAWARAPACLV